MTDRSQGRTKEPFRCRRVKETLTSKVFKLSHKSTAFRQIEPNGPFQKPQQSSMSALGTKGGPARESLNGCIILSMAALSKGSFHIYRHLLLAFIQFSWEAADGFHCFHKKLNRRGNADWRQKKRHRPQTLLRFLLIDNRYCNLPREQEAENCESPKHALTEEKIKCSFQIWLLLPPQCWFLG